MIRPGTVETARFPERKPVGLWADEAACYGKTSIMFPSDPSGVQHAKSICARCDVTEECLAHAIAENEEYGVWGGTTQEERLEIIWKQGEAARRLDRKRKSRRLRSTQ